jgi:molecular chaperone GrpE
MNDNKPASTNRPNQGFDSIDNPERAVDDALAERDRSIRQEPSQAGGDETTFDSDQLPQLQQELDESRQRILRMQADLENYRKRARRDLEEERKYACLPLIRDLLPVIDNLNRAIEAVQPGESAEGLLEGVKMVAQQLSQVLENHNCSSVPATGEPFDPMCHEAIAEQPSEEYPPGTIVHVAQIGYRLHDRVIRPSQVVVAKKP